MILRCKNTAKLSFVMMLIVGCKAGPPRPDINQIASLRIEYRLASGSPNKKFIGESGRKEILYLDVKNNKMRVESYSMPKADGQRVLQQVQITNGSKKYNITFSRPPHAIVHEITNVDRPVWVEPFQPGEIHQIRKEKIMGFDCTVFQVDMDDIRTTSWMWNDLVMKKITESPMNTMSKEAMNVEKNIFLEEELFNPPPDIEMIPFDKWLEKRSAETMETAVSTRMKHGTIPDGGKSIEVRKIIFSSGLTEAEIPLNDLKEISINEDKLITFIQWRVPPRTYQRTYRIFDGKGELIMERKRAWTPKNYTINSWNSYSINKFSDTPGKWRFEVLLDDKKYGEAYLNVTSN
jgi:hypothetical protein